MEISLNSSDSDDSDLENLEILEQLSDWDCNSDDDEHTPPLSSSNRRKAPSRVTKRVNYTQILDDAEFTFKFRINKSSFEILLVKLMPNIRVTSARNNGVAPLHQLLLTLRFYALGTMLASVADFVGVSMSTASRIVNDISQAIAHLYDEYIVMHQQSAEKFFQIGGFPRVLGVIDCSHIRIQSPSQAIQEDYRNQKGYFSLNVQAVCDADLKFMNVEARWPGSIDDATIFNNSILRAQCESGQFGDHWMLGDNAYPNRLYLLTPILNPINEAEHRYNEAHNKTRNTIERTFSIWKRRFPVVAFTFRFSVAKIQAVIIATAILHNFCRYYNVEEVPTEVELPIEDTVDLINKMDIGDVSERQDLIKKMFA